MEISRLYVTEMLDLIVVYKDTKRNFVMHLVDLDLFENQQHKHKQVLALQKIGQYRASLASDKPLTDMVFRSSSEKETTGMNKMLMGLLLHQDELFYWVRGMKAPKRVFQNKQIRNMRLVTMNDDNIFIFYDKQLDQKAKTFQVSHFMMEFSNYHKSILFEVPQTREVVLAFAFDFEQHIILLIKQEDSKKKDKDKTLVLFDISNNLTLYQGKLVNDLIYKVLKNQNFVFLKGHLYFGNSCFKIRYDLLQNTKFAADIKENQAFDYFERVLTLDDNESVRLYDPIYDPYFHRMIFTVRGTDSLKTRVKRVLVLPYLHERKVILGRTKPNCEYFNTCMMIHEKDENGNVVKDAKELVCVNLTNFKYYFYSLKGQLRTRVDFSHLKEQNGHPRAVSPNGKVWVFQKRSRPFEINLLILTKLKFVEIKQIDVLAALVSKLQKLVEESPDEEAEEYRSALEILEPQLNEQEQQLNLNIHYKVNDKMDVVVYLELEGDARKQQIVDQYKKQKKRGTIKQSHKLQWQKFKFNQGQPKSLFYFQRGTMNLDRQRVEANYNQSLAASQTVKQSMEARDSLLSGWSKWLFGDEDLNDEFLFLTDMHEDVFSEKIRGFAFSTEHVLFFNHQRIWKLDINERQVAFTAVKIRVDPENIDSKIVKVRTGSDPSVVIIRIRQNKSGECTVMWDLKNDFEVDSFDHGKNPMVVFGHDQAPYVVEDETVFFCNQGTSMKCYDVKEQYELEQAYLKKTKNDSFGPHMGYKFDDEDHNWIYLKEQLCLSFSYMTFAINAQMERLQTYQHEDFMFDKEQYNFILCGKSCLLDERLINNSQKLQYVLKNFRDIDPQLLGQLQYYQTVAPSVVVGAERQPA